MRMKYVAWDPVLRIRESEIRGLEHGVLEKQTHIYVSHENGMCGLEPSVLD